MQCWHFLKKRMCEVVTIVFMLLCKVFAFQSEVQPVSTKCQNIICWYKGNAMSETRYSVRTRPTPSQNVVPRLTSGPSLPAEGEQCPRGQQEAGACYTGNRRAMGWAVLWVFKIIGRTMTWLPCTANQAATINVVPHYFSTHRNFMYYNRCIFFT